LWVRPSVCQDIYGTTHAIFTKFFVHVACVRGSVLLWDVDDRPHRVSPGRGFLPPLRMHTYISGITRMIFTKFLCMLPTSVARSSSHMFVIGHISYWREGVFFPIENAMHYRLEKGGWQCTVGAKYTIYDCLVYVCI